MTAVRGSVAAALMGLLAIGAIACGAGGDGEPSDPGSATPGVDGALAALGAPLYVANCAGCHGTAGEGEPDWQVRRADDTLPAPPHDASGHTWHHADGLLFRIVRDGCAAYGGDSRCRMPAFGEALTDDEIVAVIEHLRSLWGPDERAFQSEVSRADPMPAR